MKTICLLALGLLAISLTSRSHSQDRQSLANVPAPLREQIEHKQWREQTRPHPVEDVEPVPWRAPTGEQLVGVVDRRYLTLPQLRMRVDLLLRNAPPLNDPELEQDRRVIYESNLLAKWIETTALAEHARQIGLTVNEEEVDRTLYELAQQDGQFSETHQRMTLIGVPEEDLRQEIRDGILVEKLVRKRINEVFSEDQLRAIFQMQKKLFVEPARARVWQVFMPTLDLKTHRQLDEMRDRMNDLRKQLRRCDDEEELAELIAEYKSTREIRIKDLGWVAENDLFPKPVLKAMFSLDPGDTSDVIRSQQGFHAVKVLERQDGGKASFAAARPHVENLLFDQVKNAIYETLKRHMEIHSNAGGLSKWRPVQDGTPALKAGEKPKVTVEEPDLSDLRGLQNEERELFDAPPSVEETLIERAEQED